MRMVSLIKELYFQGRTWLTLDETRTTAKSALTFSTFSINAYPAYPGSNGVTPPHADS